MPVAFAETTVGVVLLLQYVLYHLLISKTGSDYPAI
jgi:hypothetical protein